jgi:hypothetical protein
MKLTRHLTWRLTSHLLGVRHDCKSRNGQGKRYQEGRNGLQ